ncbi:PAS domain S-box-containing protein/diguanylate cyclase (GGDEF) domain-containing protein [Neptunomonas antarctica]|uniref:diguanylate cyclase n=2 Tax=Neptunomonas antarctica TaxID=619304 RepID=A0A1N7IXI6_9GAMM|nr:PAS domain S-box-containing protein/diguanylate cyclase (GGDEF) domain-containing protein [Neptunomonas antarctica]
MWKRFVSNNFKFSIHDAQFHRVYIINISILLISITLFFFSVYNFIVVGYYMLASIELAILLLFIVLLGYFHKTSNIRMTSYGILILLYIILAVFIGIIEHREYALYWLTVFPPMAIFLLGYKRGLITSGLFFGYFLAFMLQRYSHWEATIFTDTSIVNIVFASTFLTLLIAYFDLSLEKVSRALTQKTRELEEEQVMLDKHVIIFTFDLEGIITSASKAFYDISGYRKDTLIGQGCHIKHHFEMSSDLFQNLWSTISQGGVWNSEVKSHKKDGSDYWMLASIEPIRNVDGKHINYRVIAEDITDKKRIEKFAISDYLTKLNNRVKLDEELLKEIKRANRYKTPLSVIMLDIDYFKKVNDSYGHQMGDIVLQQIAHILRDNTRAVDTVGRWGGEEFLIVAPSTSLASAVQLAEIIRAVIENHTFDIMDSQTASFGVASHQSDDTLETLTARADKALYRAKNNGRNRVEA